MKKSKNGLLTGVCAGIGKSVGIGECLGEIIGLFLFFGTSWFWIIYFFLWLFMDEE